MSEENSNRASILVVDDDEELRKALTKVLQLEGYMVTAQPDAVHAIDFIRRQNPRFDLVISDVSMPSMKGTMFLTALKSAYPKLPVILITAFGDWDVYSVALREGAFDFLNKPLDRGDLLDCVKRALDVSRATLANGSNPS